jgi:hypothetical protein
VDGSREGHLPDGNDDVAGNLAHTTRQLAYCFLRLANLDRGVFKRLSGRPYRRYLLFIRLGDSCPLSASGRHTGRHGRGHRSRVRGQIHAAVVFFRRQRGRKYRLQLQHNMWVVNATISVRSVITGAGNGLRSVLRLSRRSRRLGAQGMLLSEFVECARRASPTARRLGLATAHRTLKR